MVGLFVLLVGLVGLDAFYVPGIAPKEFAKGDRIGEYLMMLAERNFFNFSSSIFQR